MRHGRAVGKQAAGLQNMGVALELELAMATGDIFDGVKREGRAVNGVVGLAMLHPATNNHEPLVARRVEVEIKPARGGHLRREKFRGGGGGAFIHGSLEPSCRGGGPKVNNIHAQANYSHSSLGTGWLGWHD